MSKTNALSPQMLLHRWPDSDSSLTPIPDDLPGAEPTPMARRWLADLEAQL